MSFRSSFFLFAVGASLAPCAFADCGNPATAKEVLDCVLKNDPRILASEQKVKRAEAEARAAGAWSNPQVGGEYLRPGTGNGERITASLEQKIGWGSREKAARLEWEAQKAEHQLLRQEVAGGTVLALLRLGQIEEEVRSMEGQVRLCERGLERLKGLAFLTSEQRAAKQALEWGRERLELERLELMSESRQVRSELSVGLDGGRVPEGSLLPHKEKWPAFPVLSKEDPAVLVVLEKRRRSAFAKRDQEGSRALPALSLGPVFEREREGGTSRDFFGGRLSLELPLFDRNEGNRDAAEAGALAAEVEEKSARRRLGLERERLKELYEASVKRLEGLEARVEEGEGKLSAIRSDYLAGRLSLPLALEAYREMEELLKRFHRTERGAYEALWRGYALEDRAEGQEP